MRDEIDEEKSEKDPLPLQARNAFDYHVEGWADIKARADECMDCLSAKGPWPEKEIAARSIPGQERPCLHEDVLTQYVNKVINQAQGNPIGIDVSPDGDGANDDSAEFTENRIRHIDYESNAVHAREAALESAVQQSIGVWEVGTDWEKPPQGPLEDHPDLKALFRQKITTIAAVDTWSYVLDCDSIKPDWSDMKEAFKLRWFKHDEFRQKFKKAQFTDFKGLLSDSSYSKWLKDDQVQVAEWWRVEPSYRKVLLIKGTDGQPQAVFADQFKEDELERLEVIESRDVEICKVMKRLTNGIEILEEVEWPDYEIPILVTTGRVKYEHGKRVIESLIYKAIVGQMTHDYIVSGIQEEINRAVKTKAWGAEGSFDTTTNWEKLHREPTTFAEWKIVYDKNGQAVPPPQMIESVPQIGALLAAKQDNLVDIQNMLGMSSTERMDRTAKSGKALDSLDETMMVATYHFINSWKMAIEREGRIKERLLNKVEPKNGKVSLRTEKGDNEIKDIPEGIYSGRHTVVISTGKAYKSQQEEIRDVAGSLTKSGDPMVQQAAWPMLIRAMNLGPQMDALADELEAVQPLPMQQARQAKSGKGPDPAQQMAQMQQQMKMVQEQLKQVVALSKEQASVIDSKVIETNGKKEIELGKAAFQKEVELAKLNLEELKIASQRDIEFAKLNAAGASDAAVVKAKADLLAAQHDFDFDMNQLEHHQGKEAAAEGREHEIGMTDMQQGHEAELARQAQEAAMTQPEAGA